MKRILIVTLATAVIGGWACQKTQTAQVNPAEATPRVTETEQPGTTRPADLSPIKAEARIDDVALGHALGADGAIATNRTGDDFEPGKPVYVAMEVADTPADSAVKVVWVGPNETRLGEEVKRVAAGTRYLNFSAGNTGTWATGDYRAEVWIGDEKVASEQFNIVARG
jgi:Tfp pilus assembly protein PilZ